MPVPAMRRGRACRGEAVPPNNEMNLTKPAQAMELRRLSQCSADMIRGTRNRLEDPHNIRQSEPDAISATPDRTPSAQLGLHLALKSKGDP